MKNAPIGVFDSGLGGLTALKQLRIELPAEDFIYFGDTARVPYGSRDKATLERFARSDIALLESFGVKAILIACGTVSSVILPQIKNEYPLPLIGVIDSAVEAAAKATKSGKVGIWATEASIRSGAYAKGLEGLGVAETVSVACPKLVPLIEGGRTDPYDPLVREAVEEYLAPVLAGDCDTLILGCTHFPLLESAVWAVAGKKLALINVGKESTSCLKEALKKAELLKEGSGSVRYFVSGEKDEFIRMGSRFLQEDLAGKVEVAHAK